MQRTEAEKTSGIVRKQNPEFSDGFYIGTMSKE